MKKYDSIYFTYPVVDMIVPFEGHFPICEDNTFVIDTIKNEPGGPANILICAKRLGLDIQVVGYIGNDMYGNYLLTAYQNEGLDTSHIKKITDFETRKVLVLVDSSGKHSFISMVRGTNEPYENKEELIIQSKSICFSGYYMAIESLRDEFMEIFRLSRKHHLTIFFDPGPLVALIPKDYLDEILSGVSVLLLNDTEAFAITNIKDVELSAEALAEKTVGLVVVKSGAKGCYITSAVGHESCWFPGFPVEVVDTTAAGDSFWSAFMYGYLQNWDLLTMATFANAVGAAKVKKLGSGTQVPNFDEVVSILEMAGYSIPENDKIERKFSDLILK